MLLYAIAIVEKLAGHLWGQSPFISLSCLDFSIHGAHGQCPVQPVSKAPEGLSAPVSLPAPCSTFRSATSTIDHFYDIPPLVKPVGSPPSL